MKKVVAKRKIETEDELLTIPKFLRRKPNEKQKPQHLENIVIPCSPPRNQDTELVEYLVGLMWSREAAEALSPKDAAGCREIMLQERNKQVNRISAVREKFDVIKYQRSFKPTGRRLVSQSGQEGLDMAKAKAKSKAKAKNGSGGKRGRAPTNANFILVKEPSEAEKMPKQMRGILACLKKGNGTLGRATLVERLPSYISTKQAPEKILAFYQKRLVDAGFMKITAAN